MAELRGQSWYAFNSRPGGEPNARTEIDTRTRPRAIGWATQVLQATAALRVGRIEVGRIGWLDASQQVLMNACVSNSLIPSRKSKAVFTRLWGEISTKNRYKVASDEAEAVSPV